MIVRPPPPSLDSIGEAVVAARTAAVVEVVVAVEEEEEEEVGVEVEVDATFSQTCGKRFPNLLMATTWFSGVVGRTLF